MRGLLLVLTVALAVGCKKGEEGAFADVRVDNAPGESTDGSQSRRPQLCASEGRVFVAWHDDRSGGDRVYLNRSLDGGKRWESVDLHVSEGAKGFARNPALACEGGTVALVWEDDRDGTFGNPAVYGRVSTDAGSSWQKPKRLSDDPYGDWASVEARVTVVDGAVHAVWADGRSGGFDIWSRTSLDRGANWKPEARIDTDEPGAAWSSRPVLAADGDGGVFVAWVDRRDGGNDIYTNASFGAGLDGTWGPDDRRLDIDDDPGESDAFAPAIAVGKGDVMVAWHDRGQGPRASLLAAVGDGDDFDAPEQLDDGKGNSLFAALAWDGGFVAAWRDDARGAFDILTSRSSGGAWSKPVLLDDGGLSHAESPMLAAAGGVAVVAWADHRSDPSPDVPREDVHVSTSHDGGKSWSSQQANDPESGDARAVFPVVGVSGDAAVVAWEDWRSGNPDIYARVLR